MRQRVWKGRGKVARANPMPFLVVPLQPRQLEQPVEKPNEVPTFEIWFPRLIVVPVYSQEVAGVRKEKERLTAALFLHSYTRCNLILTVRGCSEVYDRRECSSYATLSGR